MAPVTSRNVEDFTEREVLDAALALIQEQASGYPGYYGEWHHQHCDVVSDGTHTLDSESWTYDAKAILRRAEVLGLRKPERQTE